MERGKSGTENLKHALILPSTLDMRDSSYQIASRSAVCSGPSQHAAHLHTAHELQAADLAGTQSKKTLCMRASPCRGRGHRGHELPASLMSDQNAGGVIRLQRRVDNDQWNAYTEGGVRGMRCCARQTRETLCTSHVPIVRTHARTPVSG